MAISIGLTTFDEHRSLLDGKKPTLFEYAGFFPLLELDTAYYHLPKKSTVENWLTQVPEQFRFIIKLPAAMTLQEELPAYFQTEEELYQQFFEQFEPLIASGKLFCFLAQFSAQFKCTKEHVTYLGLLRKKLRDLPVAVEFRDHSWYDEKLRQKTYRFLYQQQFSLVAVDEPQVLDTPPFDETVTNPEFAMVRLHGRNLANWKSRDSQWRQKRTLYRYNEAELVELAARFQKMAAKTKQLGIIFNNNSGGDAAENALQLKQVMGLDFDELNPAQLDLF